MDEIEDPLMTRKDVSLYLKICLSSVDRLNLPCFKIGRAVRYRKSEIDEWLKENKKGEHTI